MKTIIRTFITTVLITVCVIEIGCQNKQNNSDQNNNSQTTSFANPDDAAKSALNVLQTLTADEKLKNTMSLTSDEAKQLTTGRSFDITEISYNKLLKTNPDSVSVSAVVTPMQQSHKLYQLEIKGSIKTTALVTGNNNEWKLSSAGDNRYVEMLSSKMIAVGSNTSIVEVPGLNLRFLSYTVNEHKFFISDRDVPETKITKGEPIEEQQALRELVIYAKRFEELNGKNIRDKKFVD